MNPKLFKLQALLMAVLAAVLLGEWGYGQYADSILLAQSRSAAGEQTAAAELPSIALPVMSGGEYRELVERPLFAEGRKPPAEAAPELEQPAELGQIEDWLLTGVYFKDKHYMALFTKKNEAKKHAKMSSGQQISGWLLKDILPDRVVLQQAGQQKSVMLRKPRAENPLPGGAVPPNRAAPPMPAKPPQRPARPPIQPNNTNPENADEAQ